MKEKKVKLRWLTFVSFIIILITIVITKIIPYGIEWYGYLDISSQNIASMGLIFGIFIGIFVAMLVGYKNRIGNSFLEFIFGFFGAVAIAYIMHILVYVLNPEADVAQYFLPCIIALFIFYSPVFLLARLLFLSAVRSRR